MHAGMFALIDTRSLEFEFIKSSFLQLPSEVSNTNCVLSYAMIDRPPRESRIGFSRAGKTVVNGTRSSLARQPFAVAPQPIQFLNDEYCSIGEESRVV